MTIRTDVSSAWLTQARFAGIALLCLVLSGCLEFSPYAVETNKKHLTRENIEKIEAASQPAFAPFRFVVMSDSHAGYRELEDAVSTINELSDISFVLHAGDLSESGLLQEFRWTEELLAELNVPYLTAIGNHDALNNGTKNYKAIYGPLNYSFVFNNVKFVTLNSNSWEFDNKAPDLTWLDGQLADYALYQHQVVLSHILPQDERFSDSMEADYKGVLMDNFVSLIATGHGHNYSYDEELLTSGLPIGFLITGAVLKETLVVVSVEAGGITHTRVNY